MQQTLLLPALVAAPMIGSAMILALPLRRRGVEAVSLASAAAALLLYAALLLQRPVGVVETPGPPPLRGLVALYLDNYGLILAGMTVIVGFLVVLYSTGYMDPGNREHPVSSGFRRYYAVLLLFMAGMLGVALSYTLASLFFFYELTGICSCLLISFYGGHDSIKGGVEALILTHIGGLGLLAAVVLASQELNHVSFAVPLPLLSHLGPAIPAVGALFLVACLAKSAQVPFHIWLPDAMAAPTPVSAYLHAAAMVKVGVFTFLRFVQYTLPAGAAYGLLGFAALIVALVTMYYGAFMYLAQRDVKRLLAYSTIVQLSYILLALSFSLLGSGAEGVHAAIYHMWNHSFAKASLFLAAGCLSYGLGTRSIDALEGLGRRQGYGVVAAAWIAGAAAISAIPPFNCFYSKLAILAAGFTGSPATAAAAWLALIESVVCFVVFTRTIYMVYRGEPSREYSGAPIPARMKAPLLVLIAAILLSPYIAPWLGVKPW